MHSRHQLTFRFFVDSRLLLLKLAGSLSVVLLLAFARANLLVKLLLLVSKLRLLTGELLLLVLNALALALLALLLLLNVALECSALRSHLLQLLVVL